MKRIWKKVVNIREDRASYQLNHQKYDLASVAKDYMKLVGMLWC